MEAKAAGEGLPSARLRLSAFRMPMIETYPKPIPKANEPMMVEPSARKLTKVFNSVCLYQALPPRPPVPERAKTYKSNNLSFLFDAAFNVRNLNLCGCLNK